MQPIRTLLEFLEENSNEVTYLYGFRDLKNVLSDISLGAMKVLLTRAVKAGYLVRICRNVYGYKPLIYGKGLILYHVAARLRNDQFNYISLESALSHLGVISQIPMNHITIMSSGRSSLISCGLFGVIEFVHTKKSPLTVEPYLSFDPQYRLWRGNKKLALMDLKRTQRSLDLIAMEEIDDPF